MEVPLQILDALGRDPTAPRQAWGGGGSGAPVLRGGQDTTVWAGQALYGCREARSIWSFEAPQMRQPAGDFFAVCPSSGGGGGRGGGGHQ